MQDKLPKLTNILQQFVDARIVKARIEKLLPNIQVTRCLPSKGYSGHKCCLCGIDHRGYAPPNERIYEHNSVYGEGHYSVHFTDLETQMASGEQVVCMDEAKCLARQFKDAVTSERTE